MYFFFNIMNMAIMVIIQILRIFMKLEFSNTSNQKKHLRTSQQN